MNNTRKILENYYQPKVIDAVIKHNKWNDKDFEDEIKVKILSNLNFEIINSEKRLRDIEAELQSFDNSDTFHENALKSEEFDIKYRLRNIEGELKSFESKGEFYESSITGLFKSLLKAAQEELH